MSHVITKRMTVSRRRLLKGLTASGTSIWMGLPPLVSMFNSTGTAYAAEPGNRMGSVLAPSYGV